MAAVHPLIRRFPLISDQISPVELSVVLFQLQKVLSANVSGAVVEFGCYAGTTSLFIRRLLDQCNAGPEFHVYDSFEGLPSKATQDQNAAGVDFAAGELAVSKRQFLHNFAQAHLQPPVVHKAWFKDLAVTDLPKPIAFAFLDGDFYHSILDSLELVWPRLSSGALVLVHDFHRETLPGVARAVKEFERRYGQQDWQLQANIAITARKT